MVLQDSCNRLLLFGCTMEDRFGYIVCNPATEECVAVSASSCSCPPQPPPYDEINDECDGKRYAHTVLMFDPAVSSCFHLVQFWNDFSMNEVEAVYSYSSETRAWNDRAIKWKRGQRVVNGNSGVKP